MFKVSRFTFCWQLEIVSRKTKPENLKQRKNLKQIFKLFHVKLFYNSMEIIKKEFLSLQDKEVLFQLWNKEYPEKLNYQTIDKFDIYPDALTEKQHYF